ncbi:protein translocase subunit SecF [bacterium]|nr:protein translocase subunit SecF [bacterium]|tara:strand:- start:2462 stop:3391 length:930 start_codon:yes stop_codon:yes gene_type:complete
MIKYRKIYFSLSSILVLASIISLALFQLNLGIEFIGGSLLEIEFLHGRPSNQAISDKLSDLELGSITIQPIAENNAILRMKDIDEPTHQQILQILAENFANVPPPQARELAISEIILENRFESIGPVIGKELQAKAFYAIIIVIIAIIAYIAWAFRKVSQPVKSWKYGIVAIIALMHDVIITLGIFSLLGKFMNIEIGIAFIAALLTILGYSVNDTIVVFDRVRENLLYSDENDFEQIVNSSVRQTIRRSINTSLTTLFVLLAIFFFGGETIKYFILALIIGVISGTYSSIFLASPLLVVWEKWKSRKE